MDCNSTHIVSHCWYCNRLQYTMDGMDNHSYRLQWNGAWILWRYYLLYETTIECSKNAHSIVMVVKSFKKGGNPLCERFFTFHGNKVHFFGFFKKFFTLAFAFAFALYCINALTASWFTKLHIFCSASAAFIINSSIVLSCGIYVFMT